MVRSCSLHDHPDFVRVHKALINAEISEKDAARELNTSDSMVRYHISHCISTEEMIIDDTELDPFQEMLGIARKMIKKASEMLDEERFSHEGEKLSSIVKAATDTLVKLHRMGRTFIPISEKIMEEYRKDYAQLVGWLTDSNNLCLDCRVSLDKHLEEHEQIIYGETIG